MQDLIARTGLTARLLKEKFMSHRKLLRLSALGLAAMVLQACGTPHDDLKTGAIPDDYRTKHPIVLAEVQQSVDIPVASGDRALTIGTQDVISGFLADYRNQSSGVLTIAYPSGSVNAAAAQGMRRQFRQLAIQAGIPPKRIRESTYQAEPDGGLAPVRMSFNAVKATTEQCGQWPSDILHTSENTNWENFGCATQSNLAAQIANPTDLVAPRAMTPIDAKRRTTVIGLYRDGKSTASN
ncbi:CpaD family pilus assembly protein [Gellertiella hungarica]|uniref:Pilus assembly protein CpaD n=1 Tax=Gellertiella hungarica TaxID=1572859 RepID=A0A7W6NM02_9HYPH|nr:CpaD family pilus assembly protein [Gellertiella hungarica]MBB4066458.1 pilus assembly protein CpaD [Gellertiella hungarica]